MGEIGIERNTALYQLQMWEIHLIIRGYRKRATAHLHAVRWQTFILARIQGAKLDDGTELRDPRQLLVLPGETPFGAVSESDIKALQDAIREENEKASS